MPNTFRTIALAATLAVTGLSAAQAQSVEITEWMYNGYEFIELTNMGTSAVDFTGWSFDDDSRTAGTVDLSSFGTVGVGESVIIAEADVASFRTVWNLDASVKVFGGNWTNLGRNDEINIYNNAGTLVDRLTFGDQNIPGTIRTQNISGTAVSAAALAPQAVTAENWVLAADGDSFGSYVSTTGGFVANPGTFAFAPAVPEADTVAMMLAGLGLLGAVARRRAA